MSVLPNTMRTTTEAYAPLTKASLQVLFFFCWLVLLVLLSPTFCSRLHFYLYAFHLLYFLYCIVVFGILHCCICCIALLHLLPLPPFLFLCIPASSVSLFSINNRLRLGNLKATVAVEGNCGRHITLDSWTLLIFIHSNVSSAAVFLNFLSFNTPVHTSIDREQTLTFPKSGMGPIKVPGWIFQVLSLIESEIFEISSKWTGWMDPKTTLCSLA